MTRQPRFANLVLSIEDHKIRSGPDAKRPAFIFNTKQLGWPERCRRDRFESRHRPKVLCIANRAGQAQRTPRQLAVCEADRSPVVVDRAGSGFTGLGRIDAIGNE